MATYINEPAHTFNEYLLIPGYSDCIKRHDLYGASAG